jgi:hypothetical protein
MDERTPFEQRLAGVLDELGGTAPRIDAMEIVAATRRHAEARRSRRMLGATRFVAAGAALALGAGLVVGNIRTPLLGGQELAGQDAGAPSASPAALSDACLTPVRAVSGTINFGEQAPGSATYRDEAGGLHFRDWTYHSTLDLDDDRLDGATTGALDWDFAIRAGVHRGTFRVENADGAWEGPYTGTGVSTDDWTSMSELTGEGAYEGLSAILFLDNSSAVHGSVFPTVLPSCDFSIGS